MRDPDNIPVELVKISAPVAAHFIVVVLVIGSLAMLVQVWARAVPA